MCGLGRSRAYASVEGRLLLRLWLRRLGRHGLLGSMDSLLLLLLILLCGRNGRCARGRVIARGRTAGGVRSASGG